MMEKKGLHYVKEQVSEKNVKFIRFWFTDVLGSLKSFAVTDSELERALEEGMGFDGSSIEGYARIEESDMVAMPDPSTFTILPWRPTEDGSVARMFCDIVKPDGTPYDGDPRYVLKRSLKEAAAKGYHFYTGAELEYFYFRDSRGTETLDSGGYFDLTPLDTASDLRRDTIFALKKMGINVEYSHHEVAPSQHEIDLRYQEALTMADAAMTYRLAVKEVALQHGVYATFMPKPLYGQNGSGMHTHMSLFRDGENAFFDPDDKYFLSAEAKAFVAGLLRHAAEISSVVAQWVNSYKRLVPGYEAPVYISWARHNRSTLVRVPMYKPGKPDSTRVEFRCPDPACNPYLSFAVMLAAGLKGIEEGYELPAAVEKDIFSMSPEQRRSNNITMLPGDLGEAIEITEGSELVRKALGEHVFNKFIENKKIEWEAYRSHVSQYEIDKYLPVL